jgi:hypothetical protein
MTGPTKEQLLAEIARSRNAIMRDAQTARHEASPLVHVERVIARKPWVWVIAAAILGWSLAGPKTRVIREKQVVGIKNRHRKDRRPQGALGLVVSLIRVVMPMVKPAFTAYAAKRVAEMAQKLG